MTAENNPIIEDIVDQHFEEASFLWSLRDVAATATNYSLQDLIELDERVEAHIDGLRVAGNHGWILCKDGLDHEEPGTVFVASIIAFESADAEKIEFIVENSSKSRPAFKAAVSALSWLGDQHFKAIIMTLVTAKSWQYRSLGISACGKRRVNPRAYLDKAINSSNLFLKVRALKAAGQLKRLDLLPLLQSNFQQEDQSCCFEAARSALLMGDQSALEIMSVFALSQTKFTLPALQIALRLVDGQTSLKWMKEQSRIPEQRRLMMMVTGFTGNPAYIPMLIRQMTVPELARAAGASFSMITGVDLEKSDLEGEEPEGFEAGPNDDPDDENVEMDPDEDLIWPDPEKVLKWWDENSEAFPPGTRFLAGSPITPEHCAHVLRTGSQHNRQAAALELVLSQPDVGYFNIKLKGNRQTKPI
jgi:uncharacterized protein (TIGR02270 family)